MGNKGSKKTIQVYSWRFNCNCPVCGKGDVKYWDHDKFSCCNDKGWLKINDRCEIFCDECLKKSWPEGTPKFILFWKFKCGNHDSPEGYKEFDKEILRKAVGDMILNNSLPKEIADKMMYIV